MTRDKPVPRVPQALAKGGAETEVPEIDPVGSMQAIENPKLMEAAHEVQHRLFRVIDRLRESAQKEMLIG